MIDVRELRIGNYVNVRNASGNKSVSEIRKPCSLIGSRFFLGSITSVYANLKTKFAYPVRNMEVIEAYASGMAIKVAKNSLAYAGMFIDNGSKGAKVASIDRSNKVYDVLAMETLVPVHEGIDIK